VNYGSSSGAATGWIDDIHVTSTSVTDTTAPNTITSLSNISSAGSQITLGWLYPASPDFDHVEIYKDGVFQGNATRTYTYDVTGLTPNTTYNVSTKTVDANGNVNSTWVNLTNINSGTTPPLSISNVSSLYLHHLNDTTGLNDIVINPASSYNSSNLTWTTNATTGR